MTDTIHLNELIRRSAVDAGMPEAKARLAILAALGLIHKYAKIVERNAFYAVVKGAKIAAQSPEAKPKAAGGLLSGLAGGLAGAVSGVPGGLIADGMGMANRMTKAGITRSSMRALFPAVSRHVEAVAGHDVLGDVLRTIPGVAKYMNGDA